MKPMTITFVWQMVDVVDATTGEAVRRAAMVPLPRFDNVARRQFGDPADHNEHPLAEEQSRNMSAHRAFFAEVGSAFKNLREGMDKRWPTDEHFRKWCLVETGWFLETEIDCADETHARRLATFIRTEDDYARIFLLEDPKTEKKTKVLVRKPKSQAVGAMKAEDFAKSKQDVLNLIHSLTGITPADLRREVRSSVR